MNSLRRMIYILRNLLEMRTEHEESVLCRMMKQAAVEIGKFDVSRRRVHNIAHSSDALYEIYTNRITVYSVLSRVQFHEKYKPDRRYAVYHFRFEKCPLHIYFSYS